MKATSREIALERWLIAMVVVHVVAMLAMPLVLARFLPGGGVADDAARAHAIAASPWIFRLGWLPWQITAAVDLAFAIAVARTPWLPEALRWLVLVATIAAVVPDQTAQLLWITEGVRRAADDPLAAYLAWEARTFQLTAGWGATGYTLATIATIVAFHRAGVWSRALGWTSLAFLVTMPFAAVSPLLPEAVRPSPVVVAIANAVGFTVVLFLYVLLLEAALRRRIVEEPLGRWARWRHPSRAFGWALDAIGESRALYALFEPLPVAAMASDITDVVYVNYLVDAERLEPLVPPGLELSRVGPARDKAIFTFLSYRHGRFGFRFLGPLRRLSPSGIQTNWRIHVRDPKSGLEGIAFLTNAITSTPQALGARLFSEGMPMHVLESARIARASGGAIDLRLNPGAGSAPDAEATLTPADTRDLPETWRSVFVSFDAMLDYVVPQNRALSSQPYKGRITRQEIRLPIANGECELLSGTVRSRAAEAIAGNKAPMVAFHVPRVTFVFEEEVHETALGPGDGRPSSC